MKTRRLGIVGLLGIGLVLVLCSCGGGSGTKKLSKAELATQANKICSAYHKKAKAIPRATSQAEYPKAFRKVADLATAEAAELGKLTPPSEEKAAYQQFLKIESEQIQRIRDLASLYEKGDTTKASKVTAAGNAADKKSNALLKQLGAETCA
jgi:acyl-CoA reductase-like NAD-dependent aldehyde dehydrogenase